MRLCLIISDGIKTIAIDQTAILEIKATITLIAIPIKFDCFIRAKRQRYLSEFLFFLLNLFFY